MTDLSKLNFNANDVDTSQADKFGVIPNGEYLAIITGSELKRNKEDTGSYINFCFQIIEGPYAKRLIWSIANILHTDKKKEANGRVTLAVICKAVGVTEPKDTTELHNIPLVIVIKVENDAYKGGLKSVVKSFKGIAPKVETKVIASNSNIKPVFTATGNPSATKVANQQGVDDDKPPF
jgi:hypothetical protein